MPELYFETSAILITLILLGKLFEAKVKGRTSEAIKKLMGLRAKNALVIREGRSHHPRGRGDRRGRGDCQAR